MKLQILSWLTESLSEVIPTKDREGVPCKQSLLSSLYSRRKAINQTASPFTPLTTTVFAILKAKLIHSGRRFSLNALRVELRSMDEM